MMLRRLSFCRALRQRSAPNAGSATATTSKPHIAETVIPKAPTETEARATLAAAQHAKRDADAVVTIEPEPVRRVA
jgi:hypothetical protein